MNKLFKQYRGLCRFVYKKYGFGRYTNEEILYIAGRETYDIDLQHVSSVFIHNAKMSFKNSLSTDPLVDKNNIYKTKIPAPTKKHRIVKRTIPKMELESCQ